MKLFENHKPSIANALRQNDRILLCFDFDGTLSPIAKTPADALLPKSTRNLLFKLTDLPNAQVAVISGRDFADIQTIINNPKIIVAGNHGLIWTKEGKNYIQPVPKSLSKHLDFVEKQGEVLVSVSPGALIERKQCSVCFHYRKLTPAETKQFLARAHKRIDSYATANKLTIKHGKKVIEISADTSWNKGTLILKLQKERNYPFVFYMGDDQTDEDVFAQAKNAISVRVGKSSRSKASYYIKNQTFVDRILGWLLSEISSLQ